MHFLGDRPEDGIALGNNEDYTYVGPLSDGIDLGNNEDD